MRMLRMSLALLFAGGILACNTAAAQCRGGTGGSTGTTGTGTTAAGLTAGGNLIGGNIGGSSRLLTGPGSLAYDMMMANTMAQQMAQRQQMLALEQQKVKQEKLAQRRYRAEQTRQQTADSRARTRAALAAASGLTPKPQKSSLVAYQPVRR